MFWYNQICEKNLKEIKQMSFIPVAIAHDATCKKGEEWVFHGFPKENYKHLDPKLPDESKEEAIASIIAIVTIMTLFIGGIICAFVFCD